MSNDAGCDFRSSFLSLEFPDVGRALRLLRHGRGRPCPIHRERQSSFPSSNWIEAAIAHESSVEFLPFRVDDTHTHMNMKREYFCWEETNLVLVLHTPQG